MPALKPEQSSTAKASCKYDLQLWQIESFLEQSQEQLNIQEVARCRSSEISTGFDSEKGETVEFDIIFLSDGSTVKANITVKPGEDGDGKGPGSGLEFSMDMSKIHTEEQAKAAFYSYNEMILQTLLKFTPAGEDITLYSEGGGRWGELGDRDMREAMRRHEQDFREKGINTVSLNGQMILDLRAGVNDLKPEEPRRAKPWDVPKGAPDKIR